MSMEGK